MQNREGQYGLCNLKFAYTYRISNVVLRRRDNDDDNGKSDRAKLAVVVFTQAHNDADDHVDTISLSVSESEFSCSVWV